jgi:hypothetical protein
MESEYSPTFQKLAPTSLERECSLPTNGRRRGAGGGTRGRKGKAAVLLRKLQKIFSQNLVREIEILFKARA